MLKRSAIFWTSIMIIGLIIIYYIMPDHELFLILWLGVGSSIAFFAEVLPSIVDDRRPSLWVWLFPVTWIIYLIGLIIHLVDYVYKNIIIPFNKKLDGEE